MSTITVTNDFRVYPGETLIFTNENAFQIQEDSNGPPDLLIEGTVEATMSGGSNGYSSIIGIGIGHSSFYDCTVTVASGGVLRVTNTVAGGNAYGYSSGSWSPDFVNHGLVQVAAKGTAQGLSTWDAGPWFFTNTSVFTVTSTESGAGGVSLANGGTVTNSGLIEVTGKTASTAVALNGFDSSLFNSGTIRVTDETAAIDSVAVRWSSSFGSGDYFVNNGLIQGDYALQASPYTSFGAAGVFTNNGTMLGKIDMGSAATRLVNTGVIWGDVSLGLGDDVYDGARGAFTGAMSGGDGADSLGGGERAETLSGDGGNDTITGGAGDDVIGGGRDSDLLDGGAGVDTLTYADATMGVNLDFANGRASSSGEDTISGFERVIGGGFGDTLAGSAGADTLSGGGGADLLLGREGVSVLRGDEGNDQLIGGAAFDDLNGNAGDDTASGGDGGDWVVGGKDNDLLSGDAGDDIVYGNLGADRCYGGDGNDLIRGGQGDDVIDGGAGNDWLSGDLGADNITGGAGADIFHTFATAGVDLVTDFSLAQGDRVQLDPGTAYTLRQDGANTVIDMGGGNQMVLVGVQLSTLTTGWIFGA